MKNLGCGQLHIRPELKNGRKKIALFTGIHIIAQGGWDVNNFFLYFLGILLYNGAKSSG